MPLASAMENLSPALEFFPDLSDKEVTVLFPPGEMAFGAVSCGSAHGSFLMSV
jgi:hypothetical protein